MNTKPAIDKERILSAIRAAVKKAGGRRISMDAFLEQSGIRHSQFYKHIVGWNEALSAAGFHFDPRGEILRPERLLADWGSVVRKVGGIPLVVSYQMHGSFTAKPFRERFGSWADVPRAFRRFARGKREWTDVLAFCDAHSRARGRLHARIRRRRTPRRMRSRPTGTAGTPRVTRTLLPGRPTYGHPLHLHGLDTAPVNETGVVFLFGMLAGSLGFQVQSLRTAYPDCEARRDMGSGHWQPVAIEFEYESRNFRDHGHDPKGCDIIVCWHHNWADCPKNLEVIALSEHIARFAAGLVPELRGCVESAPA